SDGSTDSVSVTLLLVIDASSMIRSYTERFTVPGRPLHLVLVLAVLGDVRGAGGGDGPLPHPRAAAVGTGQPRGQAPLVAPRPGAAP
ncbi:hypothetical protein, partial [Streptomyces sp. NPDC086010]|uniref:hypothetical protein n=1 Tax=Streptomyces sp. NPDC086010 TaxID=3365745 RepID=UPI0037D26EDE